MHENCLFWNFIQHQIFTKYVKQLKIVKKNFFLSIFSKKSFEEMEKVEFEIFNELNFFIINRKKFHRRVLEKHPQGLFKIITSNY